MGWITVFSQTLDDNASGQANESYRNIVPSISTGGTKVRVTFAAHSSSTSQFLHMSIGKRSGTTANCTATPVELKVAGSSGWTGAGGSTVVSDETVFSTVPGDSLLVVIDQAGTNDNVRVRDLTDPGGGVNSYRNSAGNPSWNLAVMGGTPVLNGGAVYIWGITTVEVYRSSPPVFIKPLRFFPRRV